MKTRRNESIGKALIRTAKAGIVALFTVAGMTAPSQAAESFKDRTITVVVPSGSGGSYHVYCQLVVQHIARHIPGNPTTVIQNRPGAGGARAAAYMANAAPKDGTVIAMIAPGSITLPLSRKNVKFDATKFNWLGSLASRAYVFHTWHTAPAQTLEDLKNTEIVAGSTGTASGAHVIAGLMNTVLGTKMKIISGYKGGGKLDLAMQRGEIHGRGNFFNSIESRNNEWLTSKKVSLIMALGPKIEEGLISRKVPYAHELVKPGTVDARAVELIRMNFNVGQGFYLPPGTPKAIVDTMRKAFADMVAAPEIAAEAKRRNFMFNPQSAEAVNTHIKNAFDAADSDTIERYRTIMSATHRKKS